MASAEEETKTAEPVVGPGREPTNAESGVDTTDKDVQDGVRMMEATTKVWTRTALIVAYAWCAG